MVLTGGSGIVVIRYSDAYAAPSAVTGSPTVTVAGGYRVYIWTGSGSVSWVGLIPGAITPTPSTSTTTGSLVVEGGVGVAGNIYAGGTLSGGMVETTTTAFASNTTIATSRMVVGPMTINTGVTLTVNTGVRWVIF
jgi:hypothetical protein